MWLSALHRVVKNSKWHNGLTFVFCVLLYMAGCLLHQHGVCDVWWFEHGLTLTIFLYVGQLFLQYGMKDKVLMSGMIYILLIVSMQWLCIRHPHITAGLNASASDLPLLLLLSVSGSMMTLYVSKFINKNNLLEYLGRNSLVIYCLHIATLGAVHNMGVKLIGLEAVAGVWLSVLQLCFTVVLLLLFSWLLNMKYLRVLQGKF